jgi:AcrR family transcriptional regulator
MHPTRTRRACPRSATPGTEHPVVTPAGTLAGVTARTDRSTRPAPPPARGRPRDPATDHAILAAVFRQLVDVGYGGLSIEAVAAEAGVAKTTVYRRYPSKRELVVAALQEEVPFAPPRADLDSHAALEAFVRQAIGMLIGTGAFRILGSLLVEEGREPGLLDIFRARVLGPRRALVEAMLERGVERGEIRPDIDPLIVTEMIAGAIFGHHVILGLPGTDAWIAALVEHVWQTIRSRPPAEAG